MADTDSDAPSRRIEELEQENEVLRERLEEAEEDNERLRREIEELRKELKVAGRGRRRGRRQPKADPVWSRNSTEGHAQHEL
jgi:predicted RNase H-like nuclease (RuvC/YqgF family)